MSTQAVTSKDANGIESVILTTHTVCTSNEGLSKISYAVLSIFELLEHLGKPISSAWRKIGDSLQGFDELMGIMALVKRIKKWTVREDGKWVWERGWEEISSASCSTVSTLISFICYLGTTLKVYALGMVLVPLKIIKNAMSIVSNALDIWDNAKKLLLTANKTAEVVGKIEGEKISPEALHKHEITKIKAGVTIVLDVMFIALSILSIITLFTSPVGLITASVLGHVVASLADFGFYIFEIQ